VQRADRLRFDSVLRQRFSLERRVETGCRADPSHIQLIPGLFTLGMDPEVNSPAVLHIVTCISDYRRGLACMIGFINTLYNQVILTSKTEL
jgi:hypothetical protein